MRKNNLSASLFIIISMMITYACNNSTNKQTEKSLDSNATTTQSPAVLNAYYEIKDALVATNSSLTKEKATHLISAIKKENKNDALIVIAESITGSDDIEKQRLEFEKLSEAIYTLAKASDFGNETIYKQYCPMAFGNKGAFWLSNKKEIMNPYFGDKMLHCGKVEETIAKL